MINSVPKPARIGLIFLAGMMSGGELATGHLGTCAIFLALGAAFGYVVLAEWR